MKSMLLIAAGMVAVASTAFTLQTYEALSPPAGPSASLESTAAVSAALLPDDADEERIEAAVWRRPAGPIRVALQAGHWRAAEAPDEQAGLRNNGTRGGGKLEWEVNLRIAELTKELLEDTGFIVEILPTTIPPGYWADLFVAIHADGSTNPNVSGYRAAAPRRDRTGLAEDFVRILERSYGEATGLRHYPAVTRRMSGYYAFNSRRYHHALHPMTTGAILETGFLTSPHDRRVIVNDPRRAAEGIAAAIREFLGGMPEEGWPIPNAVVIREQGSRSLVGQRP